MNLKRITIALLALGALFTACEQEEELGVPKLKVNPDEIVLEKGVGSATVSILATRDWYISSMPDWAALDIEEGLASAKEQTVTVSVTANPGYDRTGEIKFSIGLAKAYLYISQKGERGELKAGSGTKADPYSVRGVIDYVKKLGSDVTSPDGVFIRGKVDVITEAFSTDYGNGTFTIADEVGSAEQFTCYRVKYLGNRGWKQSDSQIEKGDEVIIYGNVVNFKGNTPETAQGTAFVYEHKGKNEGGVQSPDEITDLSVKEFIEKADETTYYRLTGKVSSFKTGTNTSGKNYMQFTLKDDTASITVYGFKEGQYDIWASKIKNGGTAVITGTYQLYTNKNTGATTHEVMNVTVESYTDGSDQPQGDITASTVADFIAKADKDTYYRLTGKVSDFKTGNSNGKNWMQFTLKDDTGSIVIYGFKDGQFDIWSTKIKNGGTAVLNGTYDYYEKNKQHEVINVTVESFTEGGGQPSDAVTGTVTEVIATADDTSVVVPEAIVAALSSQGFIVTDGTSNVYVYLKAEPTVKIGDKIKLEASKTTYYGLPELTNPTATTISSGNSVPRTELKDVTAGIDSYNAAVAEYVCVTGKLVKDGNFWNVEVPGATRKATPSSLHSSINPASLEGREVRMTGYFNTIHSGKNLLQVVVTEIGEADPNAKHCYVSTGEVKAKAGDTSASFTVSANADWTVSSDNQDVAVSPASGSADATVTLTFPVNTSDAPRTANIKVVCADAGVEAVVRFTQAKASSGDAVTLTVDFTQKMESLPQKKENGQKDGSFDFEGYTFTLHAADAYYQAESTGTFYLLIGKANSYIQFPAIDGKSLVKVKFLTGANASTAVVEDIAKADGTRLKINDSALNKAAEYEWEVPGEPGVAYRIVVCNDKNAQFQNLTLVYE
ncbi:MAG: hypothetical protein IK031_07380 [Bacteroidales bacterium]|nr:hypothetical protein [Bacteroidales bacterium]